MFELTDPSTLSDADKLKGLLIGGGILLAGGALEIYSTFINRYRAFKSPDWPRLPGVIIGHKTRRPILSGLGRVVPLVRYSFTVAGETYEHDAVMFGGHHAVKGKEAEAVFRRYPLDSAVQVIVDPKNQRRCALEETAIGGNGFTNGAAMAACGIFMLVLAAVS
jgi:hypothetical protein